MPRWLRWTLLFVAGAPLLTAGTLTALHFLPVRLAIGPCIKDWTSPTSYSPRVSKLATERVALGDGTVQVCYGRPAARNRRVFGRLVPFGTPWRLGANEPTRLYTNVPLQVAGIAVPPGRYSLYAIPGDSTWTVAVNRSTFHWGLDLSEQVMAQDIGRATVPVSATDEYVETFTIRFEPGAAGHADLVIEWEHTRVVVPLDVPAS